MLAGSTPRGDSVRGLQPLDQEKLRNLCSAIQCHPSFSGLSMDEFKELVKDKLIPSIAHLCKELRYRKKNELCTNSAECWTVFMCYFCSFLVVFYMYILHTYVLDFVLISHCVCVYSLFGT